MQLDQPSSVHSFQCVQTLAMLSQLCPSIKDQRIFHGLTTTLEILPLGPLYSLESICHAKNLLIHKTVGSITCQTLPLLSEQQPWAHLQALILDLLASSPSDISTPGSSPMGWDPSTVSTLPHIHLDCSQLPQWHVLQAPSTRPSLHCLWHRNERMSVHSLRRQLLAFNEHRWSHRQCVAASMCIEVVNYCNTLWHC